MTFLFLWLVALAAIAFCVFKTDENIDGPGGGAGGAPRERSTNEQPK